MLTINPQHITRLIVAGIVISILSLATQSHAWSLKLKTDKKHYPASNCVRVTGPDNLFYAQDGSIVNNGTKAIVVNCPIVRDETRRNSGGKGDTRAYFFVERSDFNWCRVNVIQPTKSGSGYKNLDTVNGETLVGSSTRRYSSYLRKSGYPVGAMYVGRCSLRPGSRLISYGVSESK